MYKRLNNKARVLLSLAGNCVRAEGAAGTCTVALTVVQRCRQTLMVYCTCKLQVAALELEVQHMKDEQQDVAEQAVSPEALQRLEQQVSMPHLSSAKAGRGGKMHLWGVGHGFLMHSLLLYMATSRTSQTQTE